MSSELNSLNLKPLTWFLFASLVIQSINGLDGTDKTFELGFERKPNYIPNNVVVLTFDDAPDYLNTPKVLDVLKQKKVSATFFINIINWANMMKDISIQALVRRIIDEGHILGSHSATHANFSTLDEEGIEKQLSDVEEVVEKIGGTKAKPVTLFRAPFGLPYENHNPLVYDEVYEKVAPIVARHAVHVGWNVNPEDYRCRRGDGNCVFHNIKKSLKTPGKGDYGIIIMHCVQPQTVKALPAIIDYVRNNGFVIWSTEDVVRAKYGLTSEQLIYGYRNDNNIR